MSDDIASDQERQEWAGPMNQVIQSRIKGIQVAAFFALLVLVAPAWARMNIAPRPLTLPLNWTGSDIVVTQDFCVQSTNGPRPQDTDVIPYAVTAIGPLSMTDGVNQIPVTLAWQDLVGGAVINPLADGVTSAETLTGDEANCPNSPGSVNSRLTITVSNTAITAVPPGVYTGTFTIEVSNSGRGRSTFNTPVTLDLNLPDSIRVSQLDDLDLGTYAGFDIVASDQLCVFRASGGNYGVTVTGTGAGGAYELISGTSVIPFSVTWDDGTGAVNLTPGALLGARVNAVAGTDTCNNGALNNATLGVSVLAADVNALASVAGAHSGTLIILVEMQ